MEYKYQAIILAKTDALETDRIYTLYTREAGKMRVVANGVRKPNAKLAGNLEPLTFSEIFVAKNRGRGRIIGAIAVDNFIGIKENLAALQKIFYALEIFGRFVTQEEKDEEVFDLLLAYLRAMEKNIVSAEEFKLEILTLGFIFKFLDHLGYAFEMKKCAACQNRLLAGENFFSTSCGGTICAVCGEREMKKVKISDGAVKLMRIFSENKMENLPKIRADKKTLDNLKIVIGEAVAWIV